MRTSTLLARNLAWYWRTNLAVLLGVATATGVLGGALLVGESVRASLRGLVLERLGNADFVVTRGGFFREQLAEEMQPAAPSIVLDGVVAHEPTGKRAEGIQVYGVDERFWKFQGLAGAPPRGREIQMTAALARELGAASGDTILLRIPKFSAIPLETLHGRKEDLGKTLRLSMSGVAQRPFSLRAQQGDVRAVYVPLAHLQREVGQPRRVNTIVAAQGKLPALTLADLGIRLRQLEAVGRTPRSARVPLDPLPGAVGFLSLETDSAVISDALADAATRTAQALGLHTEPVLSYLANSIRIGERQMPYSVVTALDVAPAPAAEDGIVLNQWAAGDLSARVGDSVDLDYFVWKTDAQLHTETAKFRVERIVPVDAGDRDLTPDYPGITESRSLRDWDPPFPLDLTRIRPRDEEYWNRYRTTPKAFVRLARGRALWGTRFGSLTSLRIFPSSQNYAEALSNALDPAAMGMTVIPVKAQSLEAAQGATDFGEYFVYFSFFLMVSALLLTGLFFRLGIEQRKREIGTLRALGFSASKIRAVFLLEGAALAGAGAAVGIGVALGYGALILVGLRTWWFDAVGTRLLSLHASALPLAGGALAGVMVGLGSVAWTLRGLQPETPRGLLAGAQKTAAGRWRWVAGATAAALAAALVGAGAAGKVDAAAGFFGAGALLLIAALLLESAWLHTRRFAPIRGQSTLGLRNVAYRPGRSILCIALIASATFVIVSLDAFRRDGSAAGTGGYPLLADSVLPLIHDPNSAAGRSALNLPPLEGVQFVPFRLRPGDDTSCLNLYQPRRPRILAPPATFLRSARFPFQEAEGQAKNPWLLLEAQPAGGAIPAIADANSMTYVLHRKLGEEFELDGVRFRIVAALRDSVLQSELIVSEEDFLRLFPDTAGYRFFLVSAPPGKEEETTRVLEDALSDYGFDVQSAPARLAAFHRVENSYLETFRALGALGLLLGTVGLAAVVMRNVLERRRELALLRAVGYRPRHLAAIVLVENLFLLAVGLATGAVCAAVAVAPVAGVRGGHLPVLSLSVLLALVLAAGMLASLAATAAALGSSVLDALGSE
ncbi:MAG: ABC transporter permease [Candidatus Solibacter sp.]|jgi:ABC-type antimicrobial peptide transport system permease subunit